MKLLRGERSCVRYLLAYLSARGGVGRRRPVSSRGMRACGESWERRERIGESRGQGIKQARSTILKRTRTGLPTLSRYSSIRYPLLCFYDIPNENPATSLFQVQRISSCFFCFALLFSLQIAALTSWEFCVRGGHDLIFGKAEVPCGFLIIVYRLFFEIIYIHIQIYEYINIYIYL